MLFTHIRPIISCVRERVEKEVKAQRKSMPSLLRHYKGFRKVLV
jgi:hypothetical protein